MSDIEFASFIGQFVLNLVDLTEEQLQYVIKLAGATANGEEYNHAHNL